MARRNRNRCKRGRWRRFSETRGHPEGENPSFTLLRCVFLTGFTFHFVHSSSAATRFSRVYRAFPPVLKRSTARNPKLEPTTKCKGSLFVFVLLCFFFVVVVDTLGSPRRLASLHLVIRVRAMSWNCTPLKVFRVFFKVPRGVQLKHPSVTRGPGGGGGGAWAGRHCESAGTENIQAINASVPVQCQAVHGGGGSRFKSHYKRKVALQRGCEVRSDVGVTKGCADASHTSGTVYGFILVDLLLCCKGWK